MIDIYSFIKNQTTIAEGNYDVLELNNFFVVYFVYHTAELHKVFIYEKEDVEKISRICRQIDEEIFR